MKWDVISFHTLRCRCAPLLRTSETTPLNRKFYLASSTVPMIRIDVSALHSTHLFRARNRDDSVSFPTGRAPCRVLCRRGRPNRFEDVINRTSLAAVATRRNYQHSGRSRGPLWWAHPPPFVYFLINMLCGHRLTGDVCWVSLDTGRVTALFSNLPSAFVIFFFWNCVMRNAVALPSSS